MGIEISFINVVHNTCRNYNRRIPYLIRPIMNFREDYVKSRKKSRGGSRKYGPEVFRIASVPAYRHHRGISTGSFNAVSSPPPSFKRGSHEGNGTVIPKAGERT